MSRTPYSTARPGELKDRSGEWIIVTPGTIASRCVPERPSSGDRYLAHAWQGLRRKPCDGLKLRMAARSRFQIAFIVAIRGGRTVRFIRSAARVTRSRAVSRNRSQCEGSRSSGRTDTTQHEKRGADASRTHDDLLVKSRCNRKFSSQCRAILRRRPAADRRSATTCRSRRWV